MQTIHIDDVFFIESRLKEISSEYFVLYNKKKQKWEVHSKFQAPNTLCLTVPYDVLDERTITLVNKTRIENKEKIFREIDEANEKAQKNADKKKCENVCQMLEEFSTSNLPQEKEKK